MGYLICNSTILLRPAEDKTKHTCSLTPANSPATTTYIDSFADGLAGLKKGVLKMKIAGSPYIVAKVGREKEAYPKVSLYPAK